MQSAGSLVPDMPSWCSRGNAAAQANNPAKQRVTQMGNVVRSPRSIFLPLFPPLSVTEATCASESAWCRGGGRISSRSIPPPLPPFEGCNAMSYAYRSPIPFAARWQRTKRSLLLLDLLHGASGVQAIATHVTSQLSNIREARGSELL